MKVSDYIVKILEENGITDVFGIPGVGCGHFMNSMIGSRITNHLVYHEQSAAFAACGYAQASHNVGMAYSTAGPGGTNLITGIANAYADSIPTIFMVGEKDLLELRGKLSIRQKASQEVDITSICAPITKWSYQVKSKTEVRYVFEKAIYLAKNGRPGPVVIDMPSDIARDNVGDLDGFIPENGQDIRSIIDIIISELNKANRPLLLAGNAVKQERLEQYLATLNIPIVSTLITFDTFTNESNYLGFIGMDGDISANEAVAECDLLITLGARLNFKQVGYKRAEFAKNAKIIRIDIDQGELDYRLGNETVIRADVKDIIPLICNRKDEIINKQWISSQRKEFKRKDAPNSVGNVFMSYISRGFPENTPIVVDTGSHRRWLISQIQFKKGQRLYQSSGLASMGYALPASIGVYYALKKPVICINGDGGIMMNLQELQFINRENLPVNIFVFNNHALGDIMEFQKRIFNRNYIATTEESGYLAADYEGIAKAFHLNYLKITDTKDIPLISYSFAKPQLIEVVVPTNS